jgi:hypothetical protein
MNTLNSVSNKSGAKQKRFKAVRSQSDLTSPSGIGRGNEKMGTLDLSFPRNPVLITFLTIVIGFGVLVTPSQGYAAANQDANPSATPPAALPDGDGKAIATDVCEACHSLKNLTSAHMSLDDWRDTVDRMINIGADVPLDRVETLVQYLAKNFGPKTAPPASSAPAGSGPSTSSPQPQ